MNYPSTEYLELPFLDFASFNIYLESQQRLENYLARLHNIVGDLPLVVAECGYDSYRNGVEDQASVLGWQVESVFRAGGAGCFVFAWTDEWHRGGFEIDDWDFGLTDRRRNPKPALASVSDAYTRLPIAEPAISPRVSVVVCCHNEERSLGQCLAGLEELVYPDYEVIVVDDGSTDGTAAIAAAVRGRAPRLDREPRPRVPPATSGSSWPPARSSRTSTATPGPIRTGSPTSLPLSRTPTTSASAAPTCRR